MTRAALPLCCLLFAAACPGASAPAPLSNQPEGGPCATSADCATGLTCESFQLDPAGNAWQGGSLCTIGCGDGGACPSDTTCVIGTQAPSSIGGSTTAALCIPICTDNSSCELGYRAEVCVALDGGTQICEEAETEANTGRGRITCDPPNCIEAGDCPTGFISVAITGGYSYCGK